MYGGEISGNKSNLTGGGVYNLGTMTVSGDAKISGNGKTAEITVMPIWEKEEHSQSAVN